MSLISVGIVSGSIAGQCGYHHASLDTIFWLYLHNSPVYKKEHAQSNTFVMHKFVVLHEIQTVLANDQTKTDA